MEAAHQGRTSDDPAPWVLVEAQVFEKFGWTPAGLDRMDSDRVLRALEAIGVRERAVSHWQKAHASKGKK